MTDYVSGKLKRGNVLSTHCTTEKTLRSGEGLGIIAGEKSQAHSVSRSPERLFACRFIGIDTA